MRTESPSSLALYRVCPGAYDLHYRQGVEAPAKPFFDLGKAFHYMAEEVLRGKAIEQALPEAFAKYRLDGGQWLELVDMSALWPSMIGTAKIIGTESWLPGPGAGDTAIIYGYPFRGRADLIQQDSESIILTDWKTSHRVPSQKEIDADLQLASLAVILALQYPEAPRFLLQYGYLRFGAFRARLIERAEIPEQEALLAHQLKAIAEAKEFPFTPGLACANCLYIHACKEAYLPMPEGPQGWAEGALWHEAQGDALRDLLRAHCAEAGPVVIGDKQFCFYDDGKKFGPRRAEN